MTDRDEAHEPSKSDHSPDWEALARHLAGESSPEESRAVEAVLAERPEDRELLAAVDQAMSALVAEVSAGLDVESALQKVKARRDSTGPVLTVHSNRKSPPPVRTRWRVAIPAIAAAAVLAMGVASWLNFGTKPVEQAVEPAQRFLATGVGVRDSLLLPDGSRVVLGPLSTVTVASGYGTTSREVEIRGDAYFDVVHDTAMPFTVHAGSATVQDIGTKFAVHSDGVGGIGVSVAEGSVSLGQLQSDASPVVLKAGDQGSIDKAGKVAARRGAATDDDLAWLNGRLVFREAPLSEVVTQMRRWYGIELQVVDPSLSNRHLTATFSGEPPDRVLEVLRLALGADIERHGDTVFVRSAKGRAR